MSVVSAVLGRVYRGLPSAAAKLRFSEFVSSTLGAFRVDVVRGSNGGAPLYVSTADPWGLRQFYLQSRYDADGPRRVAERVAAERLVFWDVGANYGAYTIHVAPHASRAIAVEPSSRTFACLSRTCRALGIRAELSRCAVGDHVGDVTFYNHRGHSGDGRSYRPTDGGAWVPETVPLATIDSLAQTHGIDPAAGHFLKIDVQGAEPCVLAGARALLASASRVYVLLEVWPRGLAQIGSTIDSVIEICASLGLTPVEWDGSAVQWDDIRSRTTAASAWSDVLLSRG